MKFGVMLPHMGPRASPEALLGTAKMAEGAGYDSVWTLDRLLNPIQPKTPYPASPDGKLPAFMDTLYEPLTTLTWLAGQTQKIRLGTGVLVSAFRSPALLARVTSTLDVLSGGRLICGIGQGWSQDEYETSGVPFTQKGERFNEYLQVLQAAWTQEEAEFNGQHYVLPRSKMNPRPKQNPMPLWVGGESPAALKRAARFGTGWYASGYGGMEDLRKNIQTIQGLRQEKTDFACAFLAPFGFTEQPMMPLVGPPQYVLENVKKYQDMGVTDIVLASGMVPGTNPMEDIPRFAREILTTV